MARGLHELEARLGVKQNTEASLRADLSAAVLAHRDYNAAVSKNTEFVEALAAADSNAKEFIITAKGVVGLFLGNQWSPAWIAVGFSRHSLSVPSSVDRRKALLGTMQTYFQSHPEQQMASFNVTDARAGELCTALQNAAFAVSTSNSAAGAAKTVRDRTELELRWRMSGLIGELGQLLDDDDSAWWTFGLNRPSDPATPNIPDNLVLTAGLLEALTSRGNQPAARNATVCIRRRTVRPSSSRPTLPPNSRQSSVVSKPAAPCTSRFPPPTMRGKVCPPRRPRSLCRPGTRAPRRRKKFRDRLVITACP